MSVKNSAKLSVSQANFGQSPTGIPADLFTLTNANGVIIKITNFGGVITEIHTPDKNGEFADMNLGFDRIEPYYNDAPYFGALIGRFGNRIAKGKFTLDGETYQLAPNNGNNQYYSATR